MHHTLLSFINITTSISLHIIALWQTFTFNVKVFQLSWVRITWLLINAILQASCLAKCLWLNSITEFRHSLPIIILCWDYVRFYTMKIARLRLCLSPPYSVKEEEESVRVVTNFQRQLSLTSTSYDNWSLSVRWLLSKFKNCLIRLGYSQKQSYTLLVTL